MKPSITFLVLLVFGSVLFLGYTVQEDMPGSEKTANAAYARADTVLIEYKGRIKEIIDQKCYDCHSEQGDDEEAKEELLWDELPKLGPMDQVFTLDAIAEAVEDGDMPPFLHVLWRPGRKLTDEEAKLLINWARDLSERIYKGID